MVKNKERLCQIIPTKDRPREMQRLLESIRKQSYQLDQIVIVDGSTYPERLKNVIADFPELNITYVRKYPPSLIPQRNAGLASVAPEITLVGFLDDDIVLEPGCVKAMYTFWETAGPEIGGAEYNIIYDKNSITSKNLGHLHRKIRHSIEKFFFLNNSKKNGEILKSGAPVIPFPAKCTLRIDWLNGGCNIYRRHIFEKFSFDDWYVGFGIGDDLEFSYRVAKEYQLYVVAEARMKHLPLPTNPGKSYLCGKIITINHFHFVYKNPEFSVWWCAWANLGRALSQFFMGIPSFNVNNFQRCAGHLVGTYQGLFGTLQPLNQNVK